MIKDKTLYRSKTFRMLEYVFIMIQNEYKHQDGQMSLSPFKYKKNPDIMLPVTVEHLVLPWLLD